MDTAIEAPDDTATPDAALAHRIAGGDVAAWERFFDHYLPWAYRFAYRHLNGNQADAEDLCSDILMTAARSIKRYDSKRGTLDVWLLGLARHRLVRFCRRRKRRLLLAPDLSNSSATSDTAIGDPWTEAVHKSDIVNRALAGLPQRQAAVLLGKYVSGYSVEELANHMSSTPKAVESLLSRARAAFRTAFRALVEDDSGGEKHG